MSRRAFALFFVLSLAPLKAQAHLKIGSPADQATVLGSAPFIEIRGCSPWFGGPGFEATLDGRAIELAWSREAYDGGWLARLPRLAQGGHAIGVSGHCPLFRTSETRSFTVAVSGALIPAEKLASRFIRRHPAGSLDWNWEESVFLYGLERLYDAIGKFPRYVHDYHARWAGKGAPEPDRSDLCPPALTALALQRDHGDWTGLGSAAKVVDYVRFEPRNRLGALNHLGHSWLSVFFPDSIWVDSLMMVGVFSAQWGAYAQEPDLLAFGAAQPLIYASVLQDPATGLFRHAWKVNGEEPIPLGDVFWLRGNGWVLVSIAEILDVLPPGSPEAPRLLEIFRRTADGLLKYQLPTGLWDSIANLPGDTYPETSGTSLVAYALAKGVHRGWLPKGYLPPAKAAFAGVTALLRSRKHGLSMPWISGPTDPGPRLGYELVGPVKNAPYGVGAYLLAAVELKDEVFQ